MLNNDGTAADTTAKWNGDRQVYEVGVGKDHEGNIGKGWKFGIEHIVDPEQLRLLRHISSGVMEAYFKYREKPPVKVSFKRREIKRLIWDVEARALEEYPVFESIKKIDPKAVELRAFDEDDYDRLGVPHERRKLRKHREGGQSGPAVDGAPQKSPPSEPAADSLNPAVWEAFFERTRADQAAVA